MYCELEGNNTLSKRSGGKGHIELRDIELSVIWWDEINIQQRKNNLLLIENMDGKRDVWREEWGFIFPFTFQVLDLAKIDMRLTSSGHKYTLYMFRIMS